MELSLVSKERPDRSLAAIILLAAVSLVGVIALLPSTEEKAAALLADKKYDQAISLLTAADSKGDLNAYEAFMLAQLYVLSGQNAMAVQLLEQQTAASPQATWPLQQLAEMHRQSGDFSQEAKALAQLYALEPNAERFERLAELYRLLGDRQAEQQLLTDAAARGLAGDKDITRLNHLKAGGIGAQSSLWIAPGGRYATLAAPPAKFFPTQALADSGTSTAPTVD